MTEVEQGNLYFDVRKSVHARNVTRLVIALLFSLGMIWIGMRLIPEETVFTLEVESLKTWSLWSFLGLVCVGSGTARLFKEFIFAFRAYSTTGEWHFQLSDQRILWQVPHHAHGKEEGFDAPIVDVKQVEIKDIQRPDEFDERQYWIHFHSRTPIQLQSYAGFSLPWLVEKITEAGVTCVKTFEQP